MVTIWPRQSTTARTTCRIACRARGVAERVVDRRRPRRGRGCACSRCGDSARRPAMPTWRTPGQGQHAHHLVEAGRGDRPDARASPRGRGRRRRPASSARCARGTGRRTASPRRRRSCARPRSPCRCRARSAGRACRWRSRRRCSRPAACPTARGRAGRGRSRCSAGPASSITGSQVVWSQPSPCSSRTTGPVPAFTNARRWPWMVTYWTSCDVRDTEPPAASLVEP